MQNEQIFAQIVKISPQAGETLIFKMRTDENGYLVTPLLEFQKWWNNFKKEFHKIYPDVNYLLIPNIIDYKGVLEKKRRCNY